MDMLNGPLAAKILLFTFPIALSGMCQQLFNAADTAVVGYFVDSGALAAVGTNTEIIAFIVTLSSGLSVGVNVLIAKLIGENKTQMIPCAVRTALKIAVIVGLGSAAAGFGASEAVLKAIKTPDNIIGSAAEYLRIYMIGYPFLLIYDFAAAVLRARGDSAYPFIVLACSGIANVALNLFFVTVLGLGVAGVAAATDIASALSAFAALRRIYKTGMLGHGASEFEKGGVKFAAEILKTGAPSAVQGAVFCLANIFVQSAVNRFGSDVIAGSTVAMNFEYFEYYIITAFGQTAATFVSQNHAAGKEERCKKVFYLCFAFSLLLSAAVSAPAVVFKDFFAGIFSSDTAVIESAGVRMLYILMFEPICCFYEIPAGVMRGTSRAVPPAVCAVVGTCVFRVVWIYTVFKENMSPGRLYIAFPVSWIITSAMTWIVIAAFAVKDRRRSKVSGE